MYRERISAVFPTIILSHAVNRKKLETLVLKTLSDSKCFIKRNNQLLKASIFLQP